jgi:hypothetical protein
MRRILLLGFLAVALAARMGAATEQTVEGLAPPNEQDVQAIGPAAEQGVQGVEQVDEQQVNAQEPQSDAARMATKVGHAAIGVTAAVVSLGATAAMLMFL